MTVLNAVYRTARLGKRPILFIIRKDGVLPQVVKEALCAFVLRRRTVEFPYGLEALALDQLDKVIPLVLALYGKLDTEVAFQVPHLRGVPCLHGIDRGVVTH